MTDSPTDTEAVVDGWARAGRGIARTQRRDAVDTAPATPGEQVVDTACLRGGDRDRADRRAGGDRRQPRRVAGQ